MKRQSLLNCAIAASTCLAATLIPATLQAATAETDPVGFIKVTVPASSDFRFAAPMTRPPAFVGVIQSISGSTVTIKTSGGLPSWSNNLYVYQDGVQDNYYYALIGSGTKEGMAVPITASGATTFTVNLGQNSFAGVATEAVNGVGNGDSVKIMPYWSLATLFAGVPDQTEILVYNGATIGVNLSPSTSFVYFAGFGWYDGAVPADDNYIEPGESVVVRNTNNAPLDITVLGDVPVEKQFVLLETLQANTRQDNVISYMSPVPTKIGTVNLGLADQDELLVFDNAATGKNKAPQTSLVYFTGFGWYDGAVNVDNTFELQPGHGYVVRKNSTPSPSVAVWQDTQTYLEP